MSIRHIFHWSQAPRLRNARFHPHPSAYRCQTLSLPQFQRGRFLRSASLTSYLASSSSKRHCLKRSLQVSSANSRRRKSVARHFGSYSLAFHSHFAAMLPYLQQAMPTLRCSESSAPMCSQRHSSALQPFQNHPSQPRLSCRSCWFWQGTASEREVASGLPLLELPKSKLPSSFKLPKFGGASARQGLSAAFDSARLG
jgi:hypothetical protein